LKSAILASAAVLVALALLASATSDLEADVFYKSAEGYMKDGDYENALSSVYRAKDIYQENTNTWGVQRCEKLINQMASLLTPTQLADKYYSIAGTYFLQTSNDPVAIQRSIDMATLAKGIYATVGGSTGESGKLKCEDLIRRARDKISTLTNNCIRGGDELFEKSQNSFFLGYYVEAKNFALNASERYSNCPYTPGVDKTANLLSSINAKIDDIRVQAKASYDKAVQYYTQSTPDSNKRCIEFAAASQDLYNQIKDTEGYSSAIALASRCRGGISAFEEEKRREAQDYLDEAKRLYLIPDCINSTDRANKAKSIYQEFRNKAGEEEKDLQGDERVKTNLYNSYLNDVNSLLSKIADTCQAEQMLKTAEDFYRKSQEYYLQNNLNEALAYANNARNIFAKFKNYVGISKCDTILGQINSRVSQRGEANAYLKNAEGYYNVANFEEAAIEANKAKVIYSLVYDKDNIAKVDEFLVTVKDGVAKLNQANKNYGTAQNLMDQGNYKDALPQALEAKKLYLAINYTIGVSESDRIIVNSQEQIDAASKEFTNQAIIFGVLFILSAVLILQFVTRKKAMESEFETKKVTEEEKMRRKEEEWSIRTEEDTKSRVEDELRKLIESERGKMDES
jgi:hypothetical protein